MNIKIENLDKVMASIEAKFDEDAMRRSLEQACLTVERSAKQKAPKDTGALARSITSKVEGLEGTVYSPLEYAPYVEYGTGLFADGGRQTPWSYQDGKGNWHTTSGQPPQPFLKPALDENREEILEIIKEALMG